MSRKISLWIESFFLSWRWKHFKMLPNKKEKENKNKKEKEEEENEKKVENTKKENQIS